jgi:outer membrane protein assembly factor BamB
VRPICTPAIGHEVVYVGSGFQGDYLAAYRLGGHGDIKGTDSVVWEFTTERSVCDMSSPLLVHGRLYFNSRKESPLSCLDAATGNPHYVSQPVDGLRTKIYASPIAAGGYVFLTGIDGTTAVIREGDDLQVVATNPLDEFVGGTPAAVDDELFIRGEKHLFCIKQAKSVAGAQ